MDFRVVRKLSYFVALAEELHFGRAAARLGISQPPLSQQIQALEAELKVRLFDRTKRRVKLTGAGKALFDEAKRVLYEVERLGMIAERVKDRSIGVLRIGCFTSAMFAPMPELMDRLRTRHGDLEVMIRETGTAEGVELVRRKEIDVALVRTARVGSGLLSVPMVSDHLAVAVPSSHPFASRRQLRLEEIAGENFVLFPRPANPEYYDSIVSACVQAGFSPHVTNHGLTIISQLGFVASGLGVGIVPSSFQSLGFRKVAFVRLRERIPNQISIVYRDDEEGRAIIRLMGF